jgi:hypothetical protein
MPSGLSLSKPFAFSLGNNKEKRFDRLSANG